MTHLEQMGMFCLALWLLKSGLRRGRWKQSQDSGGWEKTRMQCGERRSNAATRIIKNRSLSCPVETMFNCSWRKDRGSRTDGESKGLENDSCVRTFCSNRFLGPLKADSLENHWREENLLLATPKSP